MSDRTYAKVQTQQKTLTGSSSQSSLLQRTCACGQHTIAGSECDACRSKQSTLLRSQRTLESPSAPHAVPGSSPVQEYATSSNAAFDSTSYFGHDFSRIPIHSPVQEHGTAFNAAFDSASRFGHDFSRILIHSPTAGALQTKLAINQPGDEYEQEADRIADQVLAAPTHHAVSGAPPRIQRFSGQSNGQMDVAPANVDQALASPGGSLEPALRQDMEQCFGYDFSRVRVHTGSAAEQSAQDLNANAYTIGHDIVFGAGRLAPETQEGRRLLAHELTHVIQQRSSGPMLARSPDDKEAAAIGSEIEPLELKEWKKTLEAQGYEVFTRRQFDRVEWLSKAFSDKRARPDLAAINRTKRNVLVGDITGGPWSQTALKPGDVRKLPHDIGAEPETKHHLEKTVDNARQAYRNLPEDLKGFRVTAQDRWWKEGGYSREIVISKGTPAPLSSPPTSGAGGGQSSPTTSTPAKITTPSKVEGQGGAVESTSQPEPAVKAEKGKPLEPVVEATPGFRSERGAGIGGAFQILQAMQFANLQRAEIDKFQTRYAELQPKIDAFLERGYSVELILIVEKPDSPDVFCAAGVFCDQSQFVYFRELYINYVETVKPVISPSPPTSYPTMGPAGGRSGHVPYIHEGGSLTVTDEKDIRFLRARHADHHCEYAKQPLYPQEYAFPISPVVPRHQPAQPEKPKPRLDPAARKALAAAPARVYVESENAIQYKTAYEVIKALASNPLFGEVKEDIGGGLGRTRTIISYRSDLDKAKAEALAEIVRSKGVPTASAELSGSGDDDPGVLTIWFSRDAEKPR
jgi:Domain of unknown function (DUF4157)